MKAAKSDELAVSVAARIRTVQGQRVLLDTDLAALYGVTAKHLNQQVRRNRDRFPKGFVIELSNQEVAALRSQIVTLKAGRGAQPSNVITLTTSLRPAFNTAIIVDRH